MMNNRALHIISPIVMITVVGLLSSYGAAATPGNVLGPIDIIRAAIKSISSLPVWTGRKCSSSM